MRSEENVLGKVCQGEGAALEMRVERKLEVVLFKKNNQIEQTEIIYLGFKKKKNERYKQAQRRKFDLNV